MTTLTTEERTAIYSVPRQADGDYTEMVFTCPTNRRGYVSVRPPQVYRRTVATSCYWCDAHGRLRDDRSFDANAPECHMYPLTDEATP